MADPLEDKSIEELEAMMESAARGDIPEELQQKELPLSDSIESQAEETGEPQAEEAEQPEPEVEAKEEPTEQTESEKAESEAAEPETEEPDLDDQLRKTLIEEAEAKAKHFEQVAGRNAGELGQVKKQLRELQDLLARSGQSLPMPEEDGYPPQPTPVPVQQPAQQAIPEQVTRWALQQAVKTAVNDFATRYPDSHQFNADIGKYISEKNQDASALLESGDPAYAAQETARVLDEAYWYVKSQHLANVRSQLEEKRASQVRELKKSKLRAAPTQTGATPAPRPQPTALEDKSIDELREELERLTS